MKLKSADLEKKLPGIDSETFKSGILYYDCNVNDYRLTLHNILDSVDNHGEQLNYWFVDKIQKLASKGVRVTAIDQLTGEKIVIKGSVLVNTTGPYSNINLKNWGLHKLEDVKMMKSIHFFLPNINEEYGIVIPTDYHDRIVYAVPMDNNTTMVGITDYQEVNSVECPHVNTAEIQFALDHLNMLFPKLKLSIDQVFAPMAGIKSYLPGNQHKIIVNDFGKSKVISVVGGKMLLYRQIAKEVVDKAVKYIDKKAGSSVSDEIRLRGSQYAELTFKSFVEHRLVSNFILQQLPLDISMNLLRTYGTQINKFDFFPYLEKENGKERIFSGTKSIWAELYYCQDHEFVRKPSDFALHRTFLYLDLVQNPKQIPPFFQKAGEILKLTPQQIKEDQQEFLDTFKII